MPGERYERHFFIKDVPGGRAFYPNGPRGPGYLVDLPTEQALRRYARVWHRYAWSICLLPVLVRHWPGVNWVVPFMLTAGLGALAIYKIAVRALLKRCERTPLRLTRAEMIDIQARSSSRFYVGLMFLVGILFVGSGFAMFVSAIGTSWFDLCVGAFAVLFFGLGVYRLFQIGQAQNRIEGRAYAGPSRSLLPGGSGAEGSARAVRDTVFFR